MRTSDVSLLLIRELEAFEREIAFFPGDELMWRKLPGVSNSAANLALHVAGSLQHFIGTVLGGSVYRRDPDEEFAPGSRTRDEVIAEIRSARRAVTDVLSAISDETLATEFPLQVNGHRVRTAIFLLHLNA